VYIWFYLRLFLLNLTTAEQNVSASISEVQKERKTARNPGNHPSAPISPYAPIFK
jgi:hypothetical protein